MQCNQHKSFLNLGHVGGNPLNEVADLGVDPRVVVSAAPDAPAHHPCTPGVTITVLLSNSSPPR